MSDHLSAFIDALHAAGNPPERQSDIITDDKWHSYQIAGDPKHKKIGYYQLKIDELGAVARYGNRREGVTHIWNSKSDKKLSADEKQALKQRQDDDKRFRDEETASGYKTAQNCALTVWTFATENEMHPYAVRKLVDTVGARVDRDILLIPMQDIYGELWSVQNIFPDGEKLYGPMTDDDRIVAGARKGGLMCPLSSDSDDYSNICIVEGWATGKSVRAATGFPVFVAFDTSNLLPVGEAVRGKYPDAKIIFCADNDQWQKLKPTDPDRVPIGTDDKKNAGIFKARQAAGRLSASTIWPEFPEDHPDRPTDFNDAQILYGVEYVQNRIAQASRPPDTQPDALGTAADSPPSLPALDERGGSDLFYEDDIAENDDLINGDMGLPFKVLGYNDGMFYYFPYRSRQIVALTAPGHTINNLLTLASYEQWDDAFPKAKGGSQLATYAANALFRIAEQRGVFEEKDRVRGCGVWMDAKRVILHCGDKLFVDGVETNPKKLISRYVYVAASQFIDIADKEPLDDYDSQALLRLCQLPTWEHQVSGMLLAGFLVIAPVCGAVEHRPHIWITGEAEAGKSTIMREIVKPALGATSMNVDSVTTEASIRHQMRYNARPIVFDEAERSEGGRANNMTGVLTLARTSSTGGVITKAGQNPYTARSSFCFSSINPPIKDYADASRISIMSLKKNQSSSAAQDFQDLMLFAHETLTPEYSNRLLARTIKNMPALMLSIKNLHTAARKVIKGGRASDQISAMMAGVHLLKTTEPITVEDAEKWLSEFEWDIHTAISHESDQERLLKYICTSLLRVTVGSQSRDISIGELIVGAIGRSTEVDVRTSDRMLRQYGIIARPDGVLIANINKNLGRILRETTWSIGDKGWAATLANIPLAEKPKSATYFAPGDTQRCTKLPIKYFYEGYTQSSFREPEEVYG